MLGAQKNGGPKPAIYWSCAYYQNVSEAPNVM